MQRKNIATIGNGELVLVPNGTKTAVGVKGEDNGAFFVVILTDTARTLIDRHGRSQLVSLGPNWRFEFDPLSVNMDPHDMPAPGDLVITDVGLCIVTEDELAAHTVTLAGKLGPSPQRSDPQVKQWRIVLTDLQHDREIFSRERSEP